MGSSQRSGTVVVERGHRPKLRSNIKKDVNVLSELSARASVVVVVPHVEGVSRPKVGVPRKGGSRIQTAKVGGASVNKGVGLRNSDEGLRRCRH